MPTFNSGDIIPVDTLNKMDEYIKDIYHTYTNNNSVQNLYNIWTSISLDNSVNDEIEAIIAKIYDYINQ